MLKVAELTTRLQAGVGSDRRLDAEIVAALIAPPGCQIAAEPSLDGWDIERPGAPLDYWMEADDVPPVTSSLDAAAELVGMARAWGGSAVIASALRSLRALDDETCADFLRRAARAVLAELLRVAGADVAQAA